MKITKRGSRQGTHRLMMSFSKATYEALRDQSAKEDGYSIAGVARRVIDRGVAAGLLDANANDPNAQGAVVVRGALLEQHFRLVDDLQRVHEKRMEGFQEHLDIKDRLIAQMQRALDMYTETIEEQARDIQFYAGDRVKDVVPGRTMNAAAKGARNEHRSMSVLESAGYRCTRSAASLGAWDIIGVSSRDVVLCQVKTRDWPGTVEMETLREFVRAVQLPQNRA